MRYALLVPLLLLAVPASAQFWSGPSGSGSRVEPQIRINSGGETGKIRDDINAARDAGQITRRDAQRLRREARQIDTLSDRFGAGGMSESEARELQVRAQLLREDVIAKRSGARK